MSLWHINCFRLVIILKKKKKKVDMGKTLKTNYPFVRKFTFARESSKDGDSPLPYLEEEEDDQISGKSYQQRKQWLISASQSPLFTMFSCSPSRSESSHLPYHLVFSWSWYIRWRFWSLWWIAQFSWVSPIYVLFKVASVVSNFLQPYGTYFARLLCP